MRKSGKIAIHVQTPQEQAAWRAALLPVQKGMEARVGKELIAAINQAGK